MIFQIKKDKPTLETETIERWRRVSLAAEKERGQVGEQTDLLSGIENASPTSTSPSAVKPSSNKEPSGAESTEDVFLKPRQSKIFGRANVSSPDLAEPIMNTDRTSARVPDINQPLSEQIEKVSEPRVVASDPSLDIEQDLKRRFGSNIKSALGSGTVIEGKFKFDSPVRVDGTLSGEITSTSVLVVGKEATIEGTVKVGSLIILGNVRAEIEATDLVEVRSGGRLEGDLNTKRITIEDGGFFRGNCSGEKVGP